MIRVTESSVIDAPVDKIWPLLRDFGAVSEWLPGVDKSVVDPGGDKDRVGSTRWLTFADGSGMRERLLGISDTETAVTFAIIESELPVENYVTTIRLQPVTDGNRTFISWTGEFDVPADKEAEMTDRMRNDIYQAGFGALKKRFE